MGDHDYLNDVITKLSPRTVDETLLRLKNLLDAKGLKPFAVIDQRAEAQAV